MNDLPKYWEEYLKTSKIFIGTICVTHSPALGDGRCTVKKFLGHHDMKMTERYAHPAPDFLKGAVDLLTKKTGTKTGTKKN
jgi:hypothetical protein